MTALETRRNGRLRLAALVAIPVAIYFAFLVRHACTSVGGSDSSGYANAARGISSGRVVARIDALDRLGLPEVFGDVFVPIGYLPLPAARTMAPLYPPGFPLHLAAAAAIFGWEWGPYLVSPLFAALALPLFFALARELGLRRPLALSGAALLAACPIFVFLAIQPLSDVVGMLWCLTAVLAALRSRRSPGLAAAAGAAFGLAVFVRPGNLLLAPALLAAMGAERRRLLLFGAGGLPFAGAQIAYDVAVFGAPFRTGYGSTGHWSAFGWENVPKHLGLYPLWLAQLLTPLPALGFLASLADPARPRRVRALLALWFGAYFVFFCFYHFGWSWVDTRFLLPALPALLLGFLLALDRLLGWRPLRTSDSSRAAAVIVVLLVLAVAFAGIRAIRRNGVLTLREGEASFSDGCRLAEALLPPNAVVLSSWASGSLWYYTDLPAARWDRLWPVRFEDVRRRTESRGFRWFALIMKDEIPAARAQVPGRWKFLGERRQATLWKLEPETRPDD